MRVRDQYKGCSDQNLSHFLYEISLPESGHACIILLEQVEVGVLAQKKIEFEVSVCFFLFGFYSPFKNISLISSRLFIKGGQKPENTGEKPPDPP